MIKINSDIKKKISKELLPEIKANKSIEKYMIDNELNSRDIINELIEKPSLRKQFNIKSTVLNDINELMDSYIITEAQLIGSKATPMLANANDVKKWKKLADEYKFIYDVNKYDTRIAGIEKDMKNLLEKKISTNLMDSDLVDIADANIVYLTHAMDEAAKQYWNLMDGRQRNLFTTAFRSFTSNKSLRNRGLKGSNVDINKYFKKDIDGKGNTQFVLDILEEAKTNSLRLVDQAIKRDSRKAGKAAIKRAGKKLDKFNDALKYLQNNVLTNEEIYLTKEGNLKVAAYVQDLIKAFKKGGLATDLKLNLINQTDALKSLDEFKQLLSSIKLVEKPGMNTLKDQIIEGLKFVNSIDKELKKKVVDNTDSLLKFADDMKEIAKRLRESGNDFFTTDISKLLALRGARTARTVQEAMFYDGIIMFGKESKDALADETFKNWRKPMLTTPIPGLSDKFFHPDVAGAIEKMYNFTRDDRAIKKLLNILNDFQTLWKSMTLGLFPSTVFRNVLGNISNSLLAVYKPLELLESTKHAVNILRGKRYDVVTDTGKILNADQIINSAAERGIFATTFRVEEIDKELKTEGVQKGLGLLKGMASKINQLPTAQINNFAEGTGKLALYIQLLREGKSYDDAAKGVYKVLFDYGDLSATDKAIKHVVPFWTWTRKNFPLQIANLLSVPSRTILKLEHHFNSERPSDELVDERSQSEWLKNSAKMRITKNPKTGRAQYILLEGLLPMFDLARINRALTGNMEMIIDDVIKDISPLIKSPIELATNRSFQFHKDIQKSKLDTAEFLGFEVSPKLKAILDDWRILSMLNKGVDVKKMVTGNKGLSVAPEKDFTRMMLSWLVGTTIPYDPYYQRIVASRDVKRKIQDEIIAFKANLKKKSLSIAQGRNMTDGDTETIRGRGKNIFLMINEAYSDGKLNAKERMGYTKMLIKAFNQ